MKGPVPSQEQIQNNPREQWSSCLSRTLAGEQRGRWLAQSSYSPRAVPSRGGEKQPAFRAMRGYSSSVISSVLKRSRLGQVFKQKPKIWVEAGVVFKQIQELISNHRGPALEERYLEEVLQRNGFPVLDQTLIDSVSFIHSQECNPVEAENRNTFILPRWVFSDCGKIGGDSIGQGVGCKRRSQCCQSPAQNLGSWGGTPVRRWNRHG